MIQFGKQYQAAVGDRAVYDGMLLKRYLRRVQLQLETTVRELVERSADAFAGLVRAHGRWNVQCIAPGHVRSQHAENAPFVEGGLDNVCCYRAPIF